MACYILFNFSISDVHFRKSSLEKTENLVKDLEWFKEQGYAIPEPSLPGKKIFYLSDGIGCKQYTFISLPLLQLVLCTCHRWCGDWPKGSFNWISFDLLGTKMTQSLDWKIMF
jgi:hypothetical protein